MLFMSEKDLENTAPTDGSTHYVGRGMHSSDWYGGDFNLVLSADEDDGVLRSLGRDQRKQELKTFIDYFTEYIDKHMFTLFKKEKDRKVCDAINILFKRRENLEIFNKKALYIYIREMTGVDTPVITKVTKALKKLYKKLYIEYSDTGYIKI